MRLNWSSPTRPDRVFQSTHPERDATEPSCDYKHISRFQSTHPERDATISRFRSAATELISIHASRAGCDYFLADHCYVVADFNPRIPSGMRPEGAALPAAGNHFNPRIPSGMRQFPSSSQTRCTEFQSTHPERDATPLFRLFVPALEISIHASRAGCDV